MRLTLDYIKSRCKLNERTGCWEWQKSRHPFGYGWAQNEKKNNEGAHRVAWRIVNGEIPDGMQICHHCDNPPCCNPDHLFVGTPGDNMQDAVNKGRMSRGEDNGGGQKLTEEQVKEIYERAKIGNQEALAEEFGVSSSMIAFIRLGIEWGHVTQQKRIKNEPHRGERHFAAKMTEEQVRELRRLYASGAAGYRTLAKQFGIGGTTAWHILHDKWTHVT